MKLRVKLKSKVSGTTKKVVKLPRKGTQNYGSVLKKHTRTKINSKTCPKVTCVNDKKVCEDDEKASKDTNNDIKKPRGRSSSWCAAVGCSNGAMKESCRARNVKFHRFPKDPERCRKWVLNSGRTDLEDEDLPSLQRRGYHICSDHFEPRMYGNMENRNLLFNAYPTIFNKMTLHAKKTRKLRELRSTEKTLNTSQGIESASYSDVPMTPPSQEKLPENTENVSDHSENEVGNAVNEVTQRKRIILSTGPWCVAVGCFNSKKETRNRSAKFCSFPRDQERCRKWMDCCNRKDLVGVTWTELLEEGLFLCMDHFEPRMFTDEGNRNLVEDAYPTIFTYGDFAQETNSSPECSLQGSPPSSLTVFQSPLCSQTSHSGSRLAADNVSVVSSLSSTQATPLCPSLPGDPANIVKAENVSTGDSAFNLMLERRRMPTMEDLKRRKLVGRAWCAAPLCPNKRYKDRSNLVTFHIFPNDPQMCRKWMSACGRTDWDELDWVTLLRKGLFLCSHHFGEEMYSSKESLSLLPDVYPTIFDREPRRVVT